jgi:hypothetical protein
MKKLILSSILITSTIWGVTNLNIATAKAGYSSCQEGTNRGSYCFKIGDRGRLVYQLIEKLRCTGYYNAGNDSYFGVVTQQAVMRFQRDRGLVADGVVGPDTYRRLTCDNKVSRRPSRKKVSQRQSTKVSTQYIGTWKGDGVQDNGSKWSILITITPGEVNSVIGTIAYPSLSCGGELTLRRVGDRSIALFENLTYLGNNCISGGTVVLKPTSNSDRLEYNWLYPNGKLGGKGSLEKIDSETSSNLTGNNETSSSSTTATLSDGLVANYSFEGNAADSSPNRNNGSVYDGTFVSGVKGKGLQLTGSASSYVEVPHNPSVTSSEAIAVSLWAKVTGYNTSYSALIYEAGEQPTSSGFRDRVFTMWATSNRGVHLTSTSEGSTSQEICNSPSDLYPLNTFIHFVGVVDATKHKMAIYINGQKVSECPYAGNNIRGGDFPMRIGSPFQTLGDQSGLSGVIDDVKVYNRSLSNSEIQELFKEGK